MYKYITISLLLILGVNCFAQEEKNSLLEGLVAYWNFDKDSIFGTGNNMFEITSKNEIEYKDGIKGRCISLEKDNCAEVKSGFNLYGSFTINFWFKPSKINGTHCLFFQYKKEKYDITRSLEIGISNDKSLDSSLVTLYIISDNNKKEQSSPYCIADSIKVDKWTHLTCSYNGCSLKLFIDSTEIYSDKDFLFNIRESQSKDKIYFGAGPYKAFPFFGLIDEIMIHNRALSIDEIKKISNKQFPDSSNIEYKKIVKKEPLFHGHDIFTHRKTILNRELKAYWDFDENGLFGLNKFLLLKKFNDAKLIKSDFKKKALFIPEGAYCETKNGVEMYNNFTIICRIKPQNSERQTIFTQYKKNKDKIIRNIELGIIDNKIYFENYNKGNTDTTFFTGDSIIYNEWNFIALSINRCSGKLSVNDINKFQEFTTIMQINEPQYNDIIRFGTNASNDFNYSGYIDEFMIYAGIPDSTVMKSIFDKNSPSSFYKKKQKKEIIKIIDSDTLRFVKNYKYAKGKSVIIDTVYVNSEYLRLQIKDHDKYDMDRLRIFTGTDKILAKNIMAKKRKKNIDFKIKKDKNNYIFLHALNTGTEWINTSGINIIAVKKDADNLPFFQKVLFNIFGIGKKQQKAWNALEAEKGVNSIIKIIYEPDDFEYEHRKFEKRKTNNIRKFKTDTRDLTIEIWDFEISDKDIVSIKFNDEFVLDRYEITKTKKILKLKLKNGKTNNITFCSVSEGKKGKTTARISIKDGDKYVTESLDIKSSKKENTSLEFKVK